MLTASLPQGPSGFGTLLRSTWLGAMATKIGWVELLTHVSDSL